MYLMCMLLGDEVGRLYACTCCVCTDGKSFRILILLFLTFHGFVQSVCVRRERERERKLEGGQRRKTVKDRK